MPPEGPGMKRILTEEEWEELRPFIRLHYIDKNKPFPQIAGLLREEHGFEPTKKQFTRRIEKWGMKKNFSQSERESLLGSLSLGGDLGTAGPRVSRAKLESWRKRYKMEVNSVSTTGDVQQLSVGDLSDKNQEEVDANLVLSPGEQDAMAVDLSFDNFDDSFFFGDEPLLMDLGSVEEPIQIAMQKKPDSWPFDWGSVDITGPSGLTQLFRGLEIECSRSVKLPEAGHQDQKESNCISGKELQSLWNRNNRPSSLAHTYQYNSVNSGSGHSAATSSNRVTFNYELYPFPSSNGKNLDARTLDFPKTTLWADLVARKSLLRSRLRLLRQQALDYGHPIMISTMKALAGVCYDLSQVDQALRLYKQVLKGMINIDGKVPDPQKLFACMDIINCLIALCKYREAQTLIQKVLQEASKVMQPEHELILYVKFTMGIIFHNIGAYQRAEDFYTQVLQARLIKSGPRDRMVKEIMRFLGNTLAGQAERAVEGEKLLRTFLQLACGNESSNICQTMSDLSSSLTRRGSYEDAVVVARQAAEKGERTLGKLHGKNLEAQYILACALAYVEELDESEKLHRRVYQQQCELYGTKHKDTLNSAYSLAYALQKLGQTDEAIQFCKEAFSGCLEIVGAGHRRTVNSCDSLGRCYEDQGLYEDAIGLYEKFMEELQKDHENREQEISKCQSWIHWNREMIRERDQESLQEDEEESEDDDEDDDEDEDEDYNDECQFEAEDKREEVEKEDAEENMGSGERFSFT